MSWHESTLGNECELYQPQTLAKNDLDNSGIYKVYGANGVIGTHSKFNHENPQLLVTCRGATCGTINISEAKSWINGNAMVVKPRNANIDLYFLSHYLHHLDISKAITGAAQPQITRQSLAPIKIKFPPLAQQKRIAAILDKAAEIKAKREQAIAKLDDLAQSTFVEMFGDTVENTKKWPTATLENVLSLITYGLTVRPSYVEDGVHLISARELRTGRINYADAPKISRTDFEALSDKSKAKQGDILFSKTGSIGHCALVEDKHEFAISQNAARLVFNKELVDNVYALYYLKSKSIQDLAIRSARGNAVKDLQLGVMKQFPFNLPPLELQKSFSTKLQKIVMAKERNEVALNKQIELLGSLQKQAFLNGFNA